MTPTAQIAAIRRRVEQATPGPWEFRYATGIKRQAFTRKGDGEPKRVERKDEPVVSLGDDGACGDPDCCGYPSYHVECSQGNGAFIAHAREDIPFLLQQLDARESALRALVAQWKQELGSDTDPLDRFDDGWIAAKSGCVEALERLLESEP